MSLSQFNFVAKTIKDLEVWFSDIMNHLSAKNYDNGTWTPTITGKTGSPTVTAWYQRFGITCEFTIVIDGTHKMTSATITLPPVTPNNYGLAIVHSLTGNYHIGSGRVDNSTVKLHVPDYWVTNEAVIIKGFYKVEGI